MDIAVPNNFVATVASSSTLMIGNMSGVVYMLLGILLAFWVITLIIEKIQQAGDREAAQPPITGGEYLVGDRWIAYDRENR